jgi:hypothetical protein
MILQEWRRLSRAAFMPLQWMAAAAASVAGALISSNAAGSAADTQANAANRATDQQLQMFNTINQQQAPYRQAGYNALNMLSGGLGMGGTAGTAAGAVNAAYPSVPMPTPQQFTRAAAPFSVPQDAFGDTQTFNPNFSAGGFDAAGYKAALDNWNATNAAPLQGAPAGSGGVPSGYFAHQFNAGDLNANLAPNWAFGLQQGQGAAANALNLTGGIGGNFGKGLVDYTLAKSGDLYQNAYNNYTANQTNIFNRLSNIAGLGQTANANVGNAGTTISGNVANSQMAAGTAAAGGIVGGANALSGGLNNASSWYQLNNMMNPASNSPLISPMVSGQFSPGAYG